jgi:hypothetical protein
MIESGIKRMLDLSTSHMTKDDAELMSDRHGHDCGSLPRIVQHAHGFIVFVCSDTESRWRALVSMEEGGFSNALRAIYQDAAALGSDLMLINFDQDADVLEGLPTFDW